jgi:hypothetical protein
MAVGGRQRIIYALFPNKLFREETLQVSVHSNHHEAEDETNDLLVLYKKYFSWGE